MRCPICKKPAEYSPQNRFRPFCSERCRNIDLGLWAGEKYRIPGQPLEDHPDISSEESVRPDKPGEKKILH